MITKPKDGDLGLLGGERLVRADGGIWWHTDGSGRSQTYITPTGERAVPIDVCREVAYWIRGEAGPDSIAGKWADILDPPTPEPPRFREGDVVACGDHPYFYVVNAEGVPCHADGTTTGAPLESDEWRVIGTINPTEGDGGTNRLQDAAEFVGRASAAKRRFDANWQAAFSVDAWGDQGTGDVRTWPYPWNVGFTEGDA